MEVSDDDRTLMVGAVAYDAKVVPIWEGIREYFRGAPVEMDFVLFSNYEAQVEALLAGRIDVAWNTNLAYVRMHRATDGDVPGARDARHRRRVLHPAGGPDGRARLDRRPARQDAGARQRGLGAGRDHARATTSTREGLVLGEDVELLRFDSDVGKHGDTGRSEREALEAVLDGRADAAAVGAASWDVFVRAGEVPPGAAEPVLDLACVLALQLHGAADPRRGGRRRVDGAPAGDGLGRTPTIGGSSSSRGCANGSVRSSTGIATCSPPSTSRGSPRRW